MKKTLLILLINMVFVPSFSANASYGQRPFRRMIIRFKNDRRESTTENRRQFVRNFGGDIKRSYHLLPAVAADIPDNMVPGLRNHPDIAYLEEDIIVHALDQEIPWGVEHINATQIWSSNKGTGVDVAILDTGIEFNHFDLRGNIAGGVDYTGLRWRDGSTNRYYWNDRNGHGTHCAGIIAAMDNDIGTVGIAPEANLWAVKVLDNDGDGYISDIIQGIQWCADNGIEIASMSFGAEQYSQSLEDACDQAYSAGVFLVAAAGNGGPVYYPAAYDSVVAVSAINMDNSFADFSSSGPEVELSAPGIDVYSTYSTNGYATGSGTSFACPHVAGIAALVYAASELGLTSPYDIRIRLRNTSTDLGTIGKDDYYGYGLVNAAAASIPEPVLETIEILPESVTLYAGQTQQFEALGWDQYGDPITIDSPDWESVNEAIGTIDPSGLFEAVSPGNTTVRVTSADIVGTADINVIVEEVVPEPEEFIFSGTVLPRGQSVHIITISEPALIYIKLTWDSRRDLRLRIYDSFGKRIAQRDRSNRRHHFEDILIDLEAGDWYITVISDTRRESINYILEGVIEY